MPSRPGPAAFSRRRPLLAACAAFSLGITLDYYVTPGIASLAGAAFAAGLGVIAVFLFRPESPNARWRIAAFLAMCCVALAGGMLRHANSTRIFSADAVERQTPSAPVLFWIEGEPLEIQRKLEPERQIWTVHVFALGVTENDWKPASGVVQVVIPHSATIPDNLSEGERIRFLARLEAPQTSTLPDGFDSISFLASQSIRRVGEADGGSLTRVAPRPWYRVDHALRHFSSVRSERAHALLSPEIAAISNALLFGRRENLESGDRDAFARAGTAHLLAISGLHLNLLAAVLGFVLSRLGFSRRMIAASVVLMSVAYVFASGAPDSILRAALMNGAYAGALWFRREPDPFSAWSAAALGILFFRPADLFLPGFQLSFISVFALLAIFPALESAWKTWRESKIPEFIGSEPVLSAQDRFLIWLRQTAFVSLAAWLGTAPIVAWHMGFFSPVTIFSNLLAVPLCFVAMLAGIFMQFLDTLGLPSLPNLLSLPTVLLLGFNPWCAQAPGASWSAAAPSPLLLAVLGVLILVLWFDQGRPRAALRVLVLTPVALLILWSSTVFFPGRWEDTTGGAPRITLLNLAHGRSAWIEIPGGGHALVDAGGPGQGQRISEVLRRDGVQELALLAITEDDPDSIGGAFDLCARTPIRRVLLPETTAPSNELRALREWAAQRGIPVLHADATSIWKGPGAVSWRALSFAEISGTDRKKLPNAGSELLALRLEYPGSSALFVRTESNASLNRLFTAHEKDLAADLLILAPGRGERWPLNTDQLLSKVKPRRVIAQEAPDAAESEESTQLAEWCQTQSLPIWFVKKEGTLRVGPRAMQAFAGGTWRELK